MLCQNCKCWLKTPSKMDQSKLGIFIPTFRYKLIENCLTNHFTYKANNTGSTLHITNSTSMFLKLINIFPV